MTGTGAWLAAWHARSPRERLLIALAAIVLAGGAGYALLYQPLAQDLGDTEQAAARTRAQVVAARQVADEVAGLARDVRAARTADARAAIVRVAAAAGIRDALTAIDVNDGRVRVTFADVGLDAFATFVETLGREELLFPTEMLLAARVTPGRVRAEATLARPRETR
jgi:type II secretory pathway component PulM